MPHGRESKVILLARSCPKSANWWKIGILPVPASRLPACGKAGDAGKMPACRVRLEVRLPTFRTASCGLLSKIAHVIPRPRISAVKLIVGQEPWIASGRIWGAYAPSEEADGNSGGRWTGERAGFGALAKTVFSGRPCVDGMLTESEEVRDGGGAVASTRALPNRKDIPDGQVLW